MKRSNRERSVLFFLGVVSGFVPGFLALVVLGVIQVHPKVHASGTFSAPVVAVKDPDPTATPWIPRIPDVSGRPSAKGLVWPVYGPISAYFGPTHPLGIDIDGYNLPGAPIVAATSGDVIFSGGNACCALGLEVILISPSGIETVYGHLSKLLITQGDSVGRGQAIAIIGSTGYSTGRHLHFEVIDNGVRENPLDYLP